MRKVRIGDEGRKAYVLPRTPLLMSPRSNEPWNNVLGTCTRSPKPDGFDESAKPTQNIENESAAPAKGPANEISTMVFRSGRIDLNYRN